MRKIMSYLKSNLCLPLSRVVRSHDSHFKKFLLGASDNEIHALCSTTCTYQSLIAHPTSRGTQDEMLKGSCPDCYC